MFQKSKGFTLIELIIVIAILGIIAVIAVPRLVGYSDLASQRVCDSDRNTVERQFEIFLHTENQGDNSFNQFMNENFGEICPDGGIITLIEGQVKCSIHNDASESNKDEPPGDEVPWL